MSILIKVGLQYSVEPEFFIQLVPFLWIINCKYSNLISLCPPENLLNQMKNIFKRIETHDCIFYVLGYFFYLGICYVGIEYVNSNKEWHIKNVHDSKYCKKNAAMDIWYESALTASLVVPGADWEHVNTFTMQQLDSLGRRRSRQTGLTTLIMQLRRPDYHLSLLQALESPAIDFQ